MTASLKSCVASACPPPPPPPLPSSYSKARSRMLALSSVCPGNTEQRRIQDLDKGRGSGKDGCQRQLCVPNCPKACLADGGGGGAGAFSPEKFWNLYAFLLHSVVSFRNSSGGMIQAFSGHICRSVVVLQEIVLHGTWQTTFRNFAR